MIDIRYDIKPFLRWVGGKTKSIEKFTRYLPGDLRSLIYVEPFVGSGAMLFHVQPEHAIISDSNPHLINAFNAIKFHLEEFLVVLDNLASFDDADNFGMARARFNMFKADPEKYDLENNRYKAIDVEQAARFVYLIARCFNGLYRENSSGDFNVSYAKGLKGMKDIKDNKNFTGISRYLKEKNISIYHSDYKNIDNLVKDKSIALGKKCFFFLDPPYYPLKPSGFTRYNRNGWNEAEFKMLQAFTRNLNKSGHKFMLCNHDVKEVRELFKGYRIEEHVVPRCVSCDARHREPVKEVVILNYTNASLVDYLLPMISKGSNSTQRID